MMSEMARQEFIREHRPRAVGASCALIGAGALLLLAASCGRRAEKRPLMTYAPVAQLEQTYGRLITVSNEPTPDQHGTGDRLGLFQDEGGTVWGIPLTVGDDGSVLGCAPPALRETPAGDTLPEGGGEIVGATNEPNGWRGGTGDLELMIRDARGGLRSHPVKAVEIETGPVCMSQSPPAAPLKYYRLVKKAAGK